GTAPLVISRAALGGAGAGAFRLSADGCSGQTIQPGASCAAAVLFAPTASGAVSATLAFTDDASGSPHTVALTGTGTTTGTLSGTVRSSGNGAPVANARINACVTPGFNDCRTATTAADGSYTIPSIPPGPRNIEVFPPAGPLSSASAAVTIATGPNTQDFVLSVPQPISGGVGFQTPGGTLRSGVPVVNWNEPFGFGVPLEIPSHAAPNSLLVLPVPAHLGLDPGDGSSGGFSLGAAAAIGIVYDAQGQPTGIGGVDESLGSGGLTATAASAPIEARSSGLPGVVHHVNTINSLWGLIPKVTYPKPKDGTLSYITTTIPLPYQASVTVTIQRHEIYSPNDPNYPAPNYVSLQLYRFDVHQPVGDACDEAFQAFLQAFPSLVAAIRRYYEALVAGSHTTRAGASAPARTAAASGTYSTLAAAGTALGLAEQGALGAAAAGDIGSIQTAGTGSPMTAQVLIDGTPIEQVAASSEGVVALGSSSPVTVQFNVPSLGEHVHGSFSYGYDTPQIAVSVSATPPAGSQASVRHSEQHISNGDSCPKPPLCPGCSGGPGGGGSGYIDPSGTVRTQRGAPVPGAKVALLRRSGRRGRLTQVLRGSAIMSPANRRNPDRTNALGHFGWDVLPGFYQITVTHPGCTSVHGGARTVRSAGH
ncbi:MAG: carboxypeptidase regulatory-like domain-containing protein, partial [Solirubrobacteraceae bacterium]